MDPAELSKPGAVQQMMAAQRAGKTAMMFVTVDTDSKEETEKLSGKYRGILKEANGVDAAPTTTHFDEYESVAFVLVGAKTFYVATPDLVFQTGRGRQHESSANPFRPGSPREQAVPQPFLKIDVPAGCMLFLPRGWWHFVVSQAHTVMLCAWF